MNKKKALTMMETVMALGLIGAIACIMIPVTKNISINQHKLSAKKVYVTVQEIVDKVVNDGLAYTGDNDFSDLSPVQAEDGSIVSGLEKFSKIFYSKIDISTYSSVASYVDFERCDIALDKSSIQKNAVCYRAKDNTVWGVPQTDFKSINVVKVLNNGYVNSYVPITVYTNFAEAKKNGNYVDNYGIFFGVRQDGKVIVMPRLDCSDNENAKKLQCKAEKYIMDTTV